MRYINITHIYTCSYNTAGLAWITSGMLAKWLSHVPLLTLTGCDIPHKLILRKKLSTTDIPVKYLPQLHHGDTR